MTLPPITGNAFITLEPARTLPPAPPYTYLGVAVGMLEGVKVVAKETATQGLPLAMLSAHTMECTLKAYLSKSGNDDRLKKDQNLRHNLIALWTLSVNEGLQIQTTPPAWVQQLARLHDSPYYLRYSTGVHGIVVPAVEPMLTELAALLAQVKAQL